MFIVGYHFTKVFSLDFIILVFLGTAFSFIY